ncbi:methyltransferase regulatory domain-containing protein [Achromobacter xylosoxidans]|uniref:methyltransferase regulatory domain-containing protein n=1 Tax=Alcaligenes xylosoxydans xylosoxydans TaxID=85698 RepID=UPI0038FC618C
MTEPDLLNQAISDAYDETPYVSNAISHSAPGQLRAVAHLFGHAAPPLNQARVLEIGCAAGGNLLPFAAAHPDAKIVGVDLSSAQVSEGRQVIERLGLRNIELLAMSLTDITPDFGQFDYIITHGVYSWIPAEVREGLMRVCRENLAPAGVAYISYNTYPGWKVSEVVRDALVLGTFGASTSAEKLTKAREILSMLEHGTAESNAQAIAIRHLAQHLRSQPNHYLQHEYLEAVNSPCYFLEFVAQAQQHGLAYLADAMPETSISTNYGNHVAAHHQQVSQGFDRAVREQFLDIAIGRQFRRSLLVHAEQAANALEQPEASGFADMHFTALLDLAPPDATDSPPDEHRYQGRTGKTLTTSDPGLIALVNRLRLAWPATVPFSELRSLVRPHATGLREEELDTTIYVHLVTLLNMGALQYRLEPAPYQDRISAKPRLIPGLASLLATQQTQVGAYNLWHQTLNPPTDEIIKFVMDRLDGKQPLVALRNQLRTALAANKLRHPSGQSVKNATNLDAIAQDLLKQVLANLQKMAVLH